MSNTTDSVEIAYREHGGPWKRRAFRNDAAYEAWYDKHEDDIADVRFADGPVYR